MRILIATGGLAKGVGGIERLVAWLANSLAKKGHRTTVTLRGAPGTKPVFALDPSVDLLHYTKDDSQENVKKLRAEIVKRELDVCATLFSTGSHLLWMAALKGTGVPHVLSEHGNPATVEARRWPRPKRLAAMAGADLIHFLLPEFADSIPQDLRSKVRIVRNPVTFSASPCDVNGRDAEGKKILLSLGRLHPDSKQVSLLVKAFALLKDELPDWRLDIWGEGPERKTLERLIAERKLEGRARLFGSASEPQEKFRTAQLFCIPSKNEGFGMTVAEAMAHGLPVVGFAKCSGVNSLVKSGVDGLLAPEMTPESLAGELRKLMTDDALRAKLGAGALEFSRELSPETILPQWESLLAEAAKFKGSTALQRIERIDEATRLGLKLEEILDNERVFRSPEEDLRDLRSSVYGRLAALPAKLKSLWKSRG